MKTEAGQHGDPRHHADDIAKLKAEVVALVADNDRLRAQNVSLRAMLSNNRSAFRVDL